MENDQNRTPSGAPDTEIEYTPIRRKGREASGISVHEDEITVVPPMRRTGEGAPTTPTSVVSPEEASEVSPTTQTSVVSPEQVSEVSSESIGRGEAEPESALSESGTQECVTEATVSLSQTDGVEDAETEDSVTQTTPTPSQAEAEESNVTRESERVILPEEISLTDVLPFVNTESTPVAQSESVEEATVEEVPVEEEEFVFTPIPERVEYERVILPDEISLVDVLNEIRPCETVTEDDTSLPEDTESVVPEEIPSLTVEENTSDHTEGDTVREAMRENAPPVMEATDEPCTIETEFGDAEHSILVPDDALSTGDAENPVEENADVEQESEECQISEGETTVSETEVVTDVCADSTAQDEMVATPDARGQAKKKGPEQRRVDWWFEMIELFAFTLAFVLILTTFFFRSSTVKGSSMESTLHDKDQLILYSFMYKPKVGDIIVFEDYSTGYLEPLVKRVIATEGQTVEIFDSHTVLVDGVPLPQEYVYLDGFDATDYPLPPHTVEKGHIFVMGDHRNGSSDSRKFGDVSVETVLGKVLFRYYPTFTKFE